MTMVMMMMMLLCLLVGEEEEEKEYYVVLIVIILLVHSWFGLFTKTDYKKNDVHLRRSNWHKKQPTKPTRLLFS